MKRAALRHAGETGPLVVEAEDLLQRILNVHIAILNSDERNAQQESMTVAQAGMLGRITVATNMAGRGTDILLGGDPAQLCGLLLAQPYNQHFVDEYMATAGASDGSNGSDESIAADEVKVCVPPCLLAWIPGFNVSLLLFGISEAIPTVSQSIANIEW